ncbi:MAG TPA: hypothetical protein RMH99_14485 [Sandaracinaceae bacterium LLY-WYZ-13_1]|nr:hypothetical protein [Sandaracinaceae bacterium LLY-WYZ-13_1]
MRSKLLGLGAAVLLLASSGARADETRTPATSAAERVMEVLSRVRRNLRDTRYRHQRRVREHRGQYHFDCSGMVQWVLSRAARRSMVDLPEDQRPLAIHFVWQIERAPTDRFRGGWRRIERIEDVRPGDVFAWERPEDFESRNTGHVGFVVGPPRPVPGSPHVYTVRIADASRYVHQDDTRPWPGPGGFGLGTVAFVTDAEGRPTGYAWAGLRSRGYRETDVVFGRVGP